MRKFYTTEATVSQTRFIPDPVLPNVEPDHPSTHWSDESFTLLSTNAVKTKLGDLQVMRVIWTWKFEA